jgi:hypothetical protein
MLLRVLRSHAVSRRMNLFRQISALWSDHLYHSLIGAQVDYVFPSIVVSEDKFLVYCMPSLHR